MLIECLLNTRAWAECFARVTLLNLRNDNMRCGPLVNPFKDNKPEV